MATEHLASHVQKALAWANTFAGEPQDPSQNLEEKTQELLTVLLSLSKAAESEGAAKERARVRGLLKRVGMVFADPPDKDPQKASPEKSCLDDERIAAIKRRLSKATPGPWGIQGQHMDYEIVGPGPSVEGWCTGPVVLQISLRDKTVSREDAELISNAPADIADLLAEVEDLRARLSILEQKG